MTTMQAVTSSMLSEVGYNAAACLLYVRFAKSGKLYRYDAVPAGEYEALMNAPSIGAHLNAVKANYTATQVDAVD